MNNMHPLNGIFPKRRSTPDGISFLSEREEGDATYREVSPTKDLNRTLRCSDSEIRILSSSNLLALLHCCPTRH
jgi:hypothetical protein